MVDMAGMNQEALNSALTNIKALRSNTIELMKFLGDGAAACNDEEREAFILEATSRMDTCKTNMMDLEIAGRLLGSPSGPLNLGNSGLLSQDPALEKTNLYPELIKSHRWFDKMVDISSYATATFAQNSFKRTYFTPLQFSLDKRKPSAHNASQAVIAQTVEVLKRTFPELDLEVIKEGANTILIVKIDRVCKALILLRGLMIDWVVVKAFHENFCTENRKLDMWSGSVYEVFKKVTDHANSAMLHFCSPDVPELALKSFLTWLRSYNTLFSAPCHKCGNRLYDNLPPTWRDFRTLNAYHDVCRP